MIQGVDPGVTREAAIADGTVRAQAARANGSFER